MSLVNTLKQKCVPTPEDQRRYADLLRSNDPKSLPELNRLMIVLCKTHQDVAADQAVIGEVTRGMAAIS